MLRMPNEENEWDHQVVRYVHSPVFFIQPDNSDFEAKINMWTGLQNVLDRLKIQSADLAEEFASIWNGDSERVSAFQNDQNFFWRHCWTNGASKWKSEPITNE